MGDEEITPADQQEIVDAFQAWLKEKWKGGSCPICHETDWRTSGTGQLHTYGKGAWGGGGTHYPLGVVSCGNCGYVVLMLINKVLPDRLRSASVGERENPEERTE